MDWDSLIYVGTVVGAIVTIAGAIYGAYKWGRQILNWLGHKLISKSDDPRPVPKETLILVPNPNENWWHMGAQSGNQAMQIVTRWHVTNITPRPVKVLRAKAKVKGTSAEIEGVATVRHPDVNEHSSEYHIHPGATSPATADFWINPPVRKEGEELELRVTLIDQFGNPHFSEYLTLHYR